ncbi:alpha/beta hydrolase [Nocardia stercoris]|uniref:Esterase family protein n=1 Tax=Nocardia stercoris TaxID=2483361 RepID=A0A3M2LAZ0_9NOCA|nr:alpha/beta hydrolase family protein [Nocardia stercoris]RMI34206.1 esterase family protein [Nocardia stercoris]
MRSETVRAQQGGRGKRRGWVKRTVAGLAAALALPLATTAVGAGAAHAALNPAGFDFWVDSTMGPIKSRVFPAADGNTSRVVYLLDGERAQDDLNGWEINTNVAQALMDANINVVMPVGGESSWYADWAAPSSFLGLNTGSANGAAASLSVGATGWTEQMGKINKYTWETFLTQNLRGALHDRLGFNPSANGVIGLSMSGSSALTLAAFHPDQFKYAASLSGPLNLSGPGMRPLMRMAMMSAGGYNIDSMAPIGSGQAARMDPFIQAPKLVANGTRIWVSAASGIPTPGIPAGPMDYIQGTPIEAVVLANSRMFQLRMDSLGYHNVTYDWPATGTHNWTTWEPEVYKMLPDLSANIG